MFRSKRMSRVELVVPERDIIPVTEALAASGLFHLTPGDGSYVEASSGRTDEWQEWAATYATLERRILAVMETLGVQAGPPPADTPHLITPDNAQTDISHLEQEAQAAALKLEQEERRLAQLLQYVGQLEPIAELDVDLGTLRGLRYTYVALGTMPVANVERLQSSLERVPSALVTLQRGEHLATVVLFGLQRDADVLNRAARSAFLNPLTPPETYRGTPKQALNALQSSIERARQHVADYRADLAHLRETDVAHLLHLVWRVRASRALAETIAGYGRLRYTYLIAGWAPTAELPALREAIALVSQKVLVESSAPSREEEASIPVALDNPPVIRAFQGLVTNYGQPRYDELDPTPALALTFPLVFGLMFGDLGQGLLLALVGLLIASRKVRALQGLAAISPVLVACGAAAAVFGLLYGSVFGLEDLLHPLWIRPLDRIADILLVAVAVGVVLLSVGMVYGILNAALTRHWGQMLFGRTGLSRLIFYWSAIGLGVSALTSRLPISPLLFGAGAVIAGLAVAFGELLAHLVEGHRPLIEGGWGTYVMQAFFELFETVIGLLSNTLSYVRMGAFAVAHGGLSLVVFILAEIVGPGKGLAYWIVVALGNLFIMGFEGMIVAIQTLRLEYYEFFSKFFSGSGTRHRPLTLIAREEP